MIDDRDDLSLLALPIVSPPMSGKGKSQRGDLYQGAALVSALYSLGGTGLHWGDLSLLSYYEYQYWEGSYVGSLGYAGV